MLHIEEENIKKINILLDLFNLDINKIKYIQKDNILYENKKPVEDLLTYIMSTYKNISDICLKFDKSTQMILISVRCMGEVFDTNIKIKPYKGYFTGYHENKIYDIRSIKKITDTLINKNMNITKYNNFIDSINYPNDFVEVADIPFFGRYRLRASILHEVCIIRILSVNNNYTMNTINNNYLLSEIYDNTDVLNIDKTISYAIIADINDDIIPHDNRIFLTNEIKENVNKYYNVMKKMFKKNELKYYDLNKIKIVIEYKNEKNIKINFDHQYYIDRKIMEKKLFDYISENNNDFYNPIFNLFIEKLIQEKLELENGYFKSPDELRDYLLVSKIQRI